MNRYQSIILVLLVLALAQLACSMPVVGSVAVTPTSGLPTVIFPTSALPTDTQAPVVVTATPGVLIPTNTQAPPPATAAPATAAPATATQAPPAATATTAPNNSGQQPSTCTYRVAFVTDVTVPDDTVFQPGATFTKTWRVRNDGTCTWGPSARLHALAFTGGSKLNGPDMVSLPGEVRPGQTLDISVGLIAPTTPGTYTSEWKFRVDGDPNFTKTHVGLGADGSYALFARIKVAGPTTPTVTPTRTPTKVPTSTPVSTTRLSFNEGATAALVNTDLKLGESKSYVLTALRGQTLMTRLSTSTNATVSIAAADGAALTVYTTTDGRAANAWLPVTGDYIVTVKAGGANTGVSLTVTVPARITFASGASSARLDGKISAGLPVTYFLKASKDQTMTVKLTSAGDAARLTIYGLQDGQTLVSANSGATTWTGKLPMTQDYVIVVVPTVETTTFTIEATVVN